MDFNVETVPIKSDKPHKEIQERNWNSMGDRKMISELKPCDKSFP